MPDDHAGGAGFRNHCRGYFAGERAFFFPVEILRRDADVAAARRAGRRMHGRERRCDDDVDRAGVFDQGTEVGHERGRFADRLEHLPVAGDQRCSHKRFCGQEKQETAYPAYPARPAYSAESVLSAKAATPGSVWPPRNSSEAPPPVEMCVIRSAMPAFLTAAIESPPPMIVVPFTAATACATALVPFANASISNTPIGPFHTTVLASAIAAVYAAIVAGPMSSPIRSPIAASPTASVSCAAPASSLAATM